MNYQFLFLWEYSLEYMNFYMCAPKYLTHTLSLGLECDKNKGIFYSCFFQQKITLNRKYQNK